MRQLLKLTPLIFFVLFTTNSSFADAILELDGSGQLIGASDIDILGTLYDVSFQDGTLEGLYTDSDGNFDFIFNTYDMAYQASLSLLNQVYNNNTYDSDPEMTNGISSTVAGYILTPWEINADGKVMAQAAYNAVNNASDQIYSYNYLLPSNTTTGYNYLTYAVWSQAASAPAPVPEPATMLLFGSGIVGLASHRLRKKKK